MTVTVRYAAQARQASGVAAEELALSPGAAIAELLKAAATKHEALRPLVLDTNGKPHRALLLFVNDEQAFAGSAVVLKNGDIVEIMTPISGG